MGQSNKHIFDISFYLCLCLYDCAHECREGNGTPLQYSCLENPMGEEPGRLQSRGWLESDMTERPHFHFSLSCIGEGNGNPLQCCCLENPRDGRAWWAAVYRVAQGRTRLNRLSSSSSSTTWVLVCACTLLIFEIWSMNDELILL